MELTDAERECRNDAAAHEHERWKVYQYDGAMRFSYAQDSANGPYVDLWGWSTVHDAEHVDALIDALTTAREHVFGERNQP